MPITIELWNSLGNYFVEVSTVQPLNSKGDRTLLKDIATLRSCQWGSKSVNDKNLHIGDDEFVYTGPEESDSLRVNLGPFVIEVKCAVGEFIIS